MAGNCTLLHSTFILSHLHVFLWRLTHIYKCMTLWLRNTMGSLVFIARWQESVVSDLSYGKGWWQRILVITATNRNGQNRNGHKPKRPQTGTATYWNGHRPERPQTGTATNRNGRKPKRPQTGTATNRNRHNYIWFSGLQICVLNINFNLVSRSRQK